MIELKNNVDNKSERNASQDKVLPLPRVKKTLLSPFFQLVSDILAVAVSFAIQYYFIYLSDWVASANNPDLSAFMFTLVAWEIYWLGIFFFAGMYKNWYIRSPFDEIFSMLKIIFIGCAIVIFVVLISTQHQPRFSVLLYFMVFAFTALIFRFLARRLQIKLREKKIISISSLIVGTSEKALDLKRMIELSPRWGFKTAAVLFLDDPEQELQHRSSRCLNVPIYKGLENLDDVLNKHQPEELLIATEKKNHSELMRIVSGAADRDISVKIQPDIYDIFTGQSRTLHIYGIPLIEISSQILKPWQEALKRIYDIVISFLVIFLGMPLWLLLALIIKLESKGTVFYTQSRVGKNGRNFKIFKFRSMVPGADKQGATWTKTGDPRVTAFGRFIRKSHLDEIPQFWNVLKGEMSVVGPRPEQPKFVEQFSKEIDYYKRRLKVRPGITGWWQVKYGPHVLDKEEIENRLKDDFYYIENFSIQLDFEIMIRTVWVVLKGHGQT